MPSAKDVGNFNGELYHRNEVAKTVNDFVTGWKNAGVDLSPTAIKKLMERGTKNLQELKTFLSQQRPHLFRQYGQVCDVYDGIKNGHENNGGNGTPPRTVAHLKLSDEDIILISNITQCPVCYTHNTLYEDRRKGETCCIKCGYTDRDLPFA